jgi:5-methylthioadenosine/S-adenosylhomocysteine deaminase
VRKYRGHVVGLDMVSLKAMIDESRSHLFTAAGYRPDIFAELLPKLS